MGTENFVSSRSTVMLVDKHEIYKSLFEGQSFDRKIMSWIWGHEMVNTVYCNEK